jgi:hypothetical protein
MIKTMNSLFEPRKVIDLTNATSDYLLARGETALISLAGVTSKDLKISCGEGVFDGQVIMTEVWGADGGFYLRPNGVTWPAGTINYLLQEVTTTNNTAAPGVASTGSYKDVTTFVQIELGAYGIKMASDFRISTYTKFKHVSGRGTQLRTSNNIYLNNFTAIMEDITTPWTKIGTLTFTYATTGIALITRVV